MLDFGEQNRNRGVIDIELIVVTNVDGVAIVHLTHYFDHAMPNGPTIFQKPGWIFTKII
jgi:hypothetical protein